MALLELSDVFADRLPVIYSALFVLGVTILAQHVFKRDALAGVPYVAAHAGNDSKRRELFMKDGKSIYLESYQKFKDTIAMVSSPRSATLVTVPTRFLEYLRNVPDDTISFSAAITDLMAGRYTGIDGIDPVVPHTVKTNLTPALTKLNPILTEEVERTVRQEIGECDEWTELCVNDKLLRIVAIVSGRIFLGDELCHNEEYIDAAINYTVEINRARLAVFRIPRWQRWFRAPFLPAVKALRSRETQFYALIQPIVQERRRRARADPNYQPPDDMLTWIEAALTKYGERDERGLAKLQLGLSFAAIHTTTMSALTVLYDLAVNPELIPELREEAAAALASADGVFTSPALHMMKKMDSVMKESSRVNPVAYAAFQRKVLKPVTLPNGQQIPAGVSIEVSSLGVSHDAETFPNPERWDGLRFYKLRETGKSFNAKDRAATAVESAAQNQFVSVSPNSLSFGYGRHACPGRFFASNEIKMILARLLMTYDIKPAAGATGRYANIEVAGAAVPDPTKTLLLKRVVA